MRTIFFSTRFLVVFLVNAFAKMSDPLFKESLVTSPRITEEPLRKKTGILGALGKMLELLAPHPQINKEDQEKQDLSLAVVITDLRKAYLYDSIHNIILLVAFAAIVVNLNNIAVSMKYVLMGLLGFSLIFGQLPFIIGQMLLHERILDRYEDVQRVGVAEKLKKTAPLFPIIEFLTAMFTTGTAGGFLYFLLDQFVKDTIK